MASRNHGDGKDTTGRETNRVSHLRRLGTKLADQVRLALGKETVSGKAEASALEKEIRSAAWKKTHKPSVLEPLGPAKSDIEQWRNHMAALGSRKHLKEWSLRGAQIAALRTVSGGRHGDDKRKGVVLSEVDAAAWEKTGKHMGFVASPDQKKQLVKMIAPQMSHLLRQPSVDSWQTDSSRAPTITNTPESSTKPASGITAARREQRTSLMGKSRDREGR
jgi:hypothetical protein